MSNLSDLLKEIAGTNSGAVQFAGNVLGTLADVAGTVGAVEGVIGLFVSNDDAIAAKLNEIEAEIEQDFAAIQQEIAGINAELRAQNILARLNNLDPPIAQAQTAIEQLPQALHQNPPVTEEYKLSQIGLCLDAINQLDSDDKWLTVFADEIYYSQVPGNIPGPDFDSWTGALTPTPNADGTVFSDRYVLPLFLRTLYDFILIGTVFDPNFVEDYKNPLTDFVTRLQTAYETSTQGIIAVRTPTADAFGIDLSGAETLHYTTDPDGMVSGWGTNGDPASPESEYGVVHLYSGYSNLSYYPSAPQEGISEPPVPDIKPNLFLLARMAVLNLAIRSIWKEAYSELGFPAVWSTINMVLQLTGSPPLGTIDMNTVWSFREVEKILVSASTEAASFFGPAFEDPGLPNSTITSLALLTRQAGPAERTVYLGPEEGYTTLEPVPIGGSPQRPLSFRKALSDALAAATNTQRITL